MIIFDGGGSGFVVLTACEKDWNINFINLSSMVSPYYLQKVYHLIFNIKSIKIKPNAQIFFVELIHYLGVF